MAQRWASANVLKAVFNLCFLALFLQVLAFAEWIFATSLSWRSPIAHLVPYFAVLLGAQVVALMLYLRRPWVAVVVAWLGVVMILTRAVPWDSPAWSSELRRYEFELVFLVVAHLGFGAFVLMKRAEAEEVAEVAGISTGPAGTPAVKD